MNPPDDSSKRLKRRAQPWILLIAAGAALILLAAGVSGVGWALAPEPPGDETPAFSLADFVVNLPVALYDSTPESSPPGSGGGGTGDLDTSHAGYFDTYEGSKTCNECHLEEAAEVHGSVHYQWNGPAPHVVNMETGGKLGGINDFCGYPDINFIGQMTNLDGETVDGGCATCHVGLGQKPGLEATAAELEEIDCLICHSESYRRKVIKEGESFRFAPAPERMSVPLEVGITDIEKPGRATCVACHAYAGGGCNNKRGDIESAHIEPPSKDFDVHMASKELGGAGLVCSDCHTTRDHRIAGRGVDLRPTDLDEPVRCTNCHEDRPHDSSRLNNHTDRVDCTVCHIPYFAKIATTDIFRDFRFTEVYEVKRLYEPKIERAGMVIPDYRFWNGDSYIYEFGTPVNPGANGKTLMAGPMGDINDPNAKLFAFKHHDAIQAFDPVSLRLLPLKMGILFQTGNVEAAVLEGAAAVGWDLPQGYDYIPTERYMGIFHEVSPADQALECQECHESDQRVDFPALGYSLKDQRNGGPLCTSCHENKNDEWKESEFFTKVHDKHAEKDIECQVCHTFEPAP